MRRKRRPIRQRHSESGVALLIAIFVLLLVSIVAIALLISSGTETALGANYRSSSNVYYASLAGLEEARGRLLPRNANYFNNTNPGFLPPIGTTLPVGQVRYLTNPLGAENVLTAYADTEYSTEFTGAPTIQTAASVSGNNAQGIPGPFFKWVRINAATEQSIQTDVDQDSSLDSTTPLSYDPAHLDSFGNLKPSLIVSTSPPPTAVQALEITSLAVLPNGSQKLLQYLVAPTTLNLNVPFPNLPAALTFAGNKVGDKSAYTFPVPPNGLSVPTSGSFLINGNDQFSAGSCAPGSTPVYAIGYTNNSDSSGSTITTAIAAGTHPANYTGYGGTTPNTNPVAASLASNLQTVAGLDNLVQTITQNADLVLNGPLTQSDASNYFPAWMSSTNPATVVVNGDFTFNGWHSTGYGILLVTGQFTYDPDTSWNGLVLVIGKGIMYSHQGGVGQINGAVFLATTVDASGNPLPYGSPLNSPLFDFEPGAGSYGIYYSNCWAKYVQVPWTYKVLSFHEISQ